MEADRAMKPIINYSSRKLTSEYITQLEVKHGVKAIESSEKGLVFFFDDDKQGLLLLTETGQILLTRKQARELKDVYEMVFG